MQLFNLVTLLSLQMSLTSALTISSGNVKRSIVSDVVLYAYGQGATDWPISFGLNDSERIARPSHFSLDIMLKLCPRQALRYSQPREYLGKPCPGEMEPVS